MELNRQNVRKIMGIIAFGIGLFWLLNNLGPITVSFKRIFNVFSPFILGGVLAFILNIPMSKIENYIKSKQKKKKSKLPVRTISITLSLLIFLFVILTISLLLIPELVENIQTLLKNIPGFINETQEWILKLVNDYPDIQVRIKEAFADNANINNIAVTVLNYVINGSLNFVSSLVTSLFTIFTAIVFAIYMLSQKEYLIKGIKKMMFAYLKPSHVNKITEIGELANKTFSKFISGQCVEVIILGCIFFVVLTAFRFPYALIISVLITITALIPMFGAMIAMVIGALLIAVTNPLQAVIFIVVFQVIQQIENNFIYPKVVGKSVGLSSIWTLLAILVGGSLMGVTGMLLGLPLASVLYAILRNETNQRLNEKKIKIK